ncbi:hypothetical protein [Embleya sp. NPDC050493]|uniref:hypothetical protein n=1 Tax=Embleya sp. NPDC050493 TaxID=3363989 RepID=UPI003798E2CD
MGSKTPASGSSSIAVERNGRTFPKGEDTLQAFLAALYANHPDDPEAFDSLPDHVTQCAIEASGISIPPQSPRRHRVDVEPLSDVTGHVVGADADVVHGAVEWPGAGHGQDPPRGGRRRKQAFGMRKAGLVRR